MKLAPGSLAVPVIAAITVAAVCTLAAATFAAGLPATPADVKSLARVAAARLDEADHALARGFAHGTAEHLREASLEFRQLGESLPPRARHRFVDDSLVLEGAAIDADHAALRSRAALWRRTLLPRLHLAMYAPFAAVR
jgi:hypothetical protein